MTRRQFARLSALALPALAQQRIQNDRDRKAVEEALNGWFMQSMETHDRRIAWWREARFGCFIHWGAYSYLGGEWNEQPVRGYAEHIMRIKKIPLAAYKKDVVANFNPVDFDAAAWVNTIRGAGMKYVIITAKHHDGFAMYPSKVSPYNIAEATKFKRDPMRELCDACRKNGLRFGFYYSHAFDWEDPNAPGNDWDYDNPGGDHALHGGVNWFDKEPKLLDRVRKYVDGKAIPQVVELAKMYQPDIMWFDTPQKLPVSEQLRVLKAMREAGPDIVVDGRCARGYGYNFGDYQSTSDRAAEFVPTAGDWESMPTTNESYGYHRHDLTHKPHSYFIRLLAKAAARGGNILMNIGPMGDGKIDPKDREILAGMGKWMAVNGESIYGTARTPLPVQPWGESTRKGNTIHLHAFEWPADGKLIVGGVKNEVHSRYKITRITPNDVAIEVPENALDTVDSAIAIESRSEWDVNAVRLLATNGFTNVLRSFDCDSHGKLKFGDGKIPHAYVEGWTDPKDFIAWQVRTNNAAKFGIAVRYTTASPEANGKYEVSIGDAKLTANVEPAPNVNTSRTVELGNLTIPAGEHEIRVSAISIKSGELMRLFEVSLKPMQY